MMNFPKVYSVFKRKTSSGSRLRNRPLGYSDLEDRKLLAGLISSGAVTLDALNSVLRIEGTTGDDQVFVSTPNATEVRVSFNGQFESFARSSVDQIVFNGGLGDDVFNSSQSEVGVTASGGFGNDRLTGGSAADVISGGAGDDTVDGGAGDDIITGGAGVDALRGGAGDDTLRGDAGDDLLSGGEGNDRLVGGTENDTLVGESGDDSLIGGDGDDVLAGGDGDDGLFGGNGNDELFGQSGEDRLNGNAGDDTVSGGGGNDFIQGGNGNDTVLGDAGDDTAFGNLGDDTVNGGSGNDFQIGGAGDDIVIGGFGDDILGGDVGNDTIYGNEGNDLIFGGDGEDTIHGGVGNDLLFGQNGHDAIFGGDGNDRVVGNNGNDFLDGEAGDDFIGGNLGSDRLFGGDGDDDLRGGFGDDGLFGGIGGSDRLAGDGGSDRLIFVGSEEVVNSQSFDSLVEFRDGTSRWTNREILVIDNGLNLLQRRIGNNRLARDPVLNQPIVFVKENTLPAGPGLGTTRVVDAERQYLYADWEESDSAANQARTADVPRAISLAWASTEAIGAVLPNSDQLFNRFAQISGWRPTDGGDFFRVSEDGEFFYREDTVFADETGRINPTQDWASAWEFFFSPPAPIEVPDVEPVEPTERNLLMGESITIPSFLEIGVTQRLTNFEFVVDTAGPVTIFTGVAGSFVTNSAFDTELFLFERNVDGTLGQLLAQDDDSGGGLDSQITLNLQAGEYALVVGDFPISEFQARSGFSTGDGGQFLITFEGTDGVGPLPAGPVVAGSVTPATPTPPVVDDPLENPVILAKLSVLDDLFTGLEIF